MVYLEEDYKFRRCMHSLKTFSPELEIDLIKVENPSDKTDPLDEMNKYFASEKFVDDVIVWHPDMYATKGWYDKLKEHYEDFDVVGLKLLYPNGLIQHFGGVLRENGVGMHPHQGTLNIGLTKPVDCAYVTGPGTVIKQKVVKKLGTQLFDSRFFKGYYGDVDFCFRARDAGFTVGVVPVEVVHEEGMDSIKKRPPEVTAMYQQNHHAQFISKWMNTLAQCKK